MLLFAATAFGAGYGVPVDGFPSLAERQVLLWTNAARVDPTAFSGDYSAGGCSTADFSSDEKTAKTPYYLDLALTEAARAHSEDMNDNGCFDHDSCDGTPWDTRIHSYYTESYTIGENIAYGSDDPRYAVLSMWMCSHSGHRANIMSGSYDEMGPGVDGVYMTQDFAGGGILPDGSPPVHVAADVDGWFYADWGASSAPDSIDVVVDGVATELTLVYGDAAQGMYAADPDFSPGDAWYVRWTSGSKSGTFPEDGSYVAGKSDWSEDRADAGGESGGGGGGGGTGSGDDTSGGSDGSKDDGSEFHASGCASAGGQGVGLLGLGLAALTLRRRR